MSELENLSAPSEVEEHDQSLVEEILEEVIEQVEDEQEHTIPDVEEPLSKEEARDEEEHSPSAYYNKRIAKLTAQRKAAEEKSVNLERQLQQAQQRVAQNLINEEWYLDPRTGNRVDKPRASDYATKSGAEYLEAINNFDRSKERVKEQLTTVQKAQLKEQQAWASYSERVKDVKELYKDFEDVVTNNSMKTFQDKNPGFISAVVRSEKGPEIAYLIAKSPDLMEALEDLDDIEKIKELGRIEAMLENSQKPKLNSNAPKPITKPVATSKSVTSSKDFSTLSIKEKRELFKRKK